MEKTPIWLIVLQVISNLAIVATFIIYWMQLRAMREQLSIAQRASRTQNLFTVIEYLQRPQFTEARRMLLSLKGKPYQKWNEEEKLAALRACSGYDAVAILIRDDQEATDVVAMNWGFSIKNCFDIASPLFSEVRHSRGGNTWSGFESLAEAVPRNLIYKQRDS
jgi:hypothetical protein